MTEITKWEYTTGDYMNSNLPGHKDINELGKQGWEAYGYDSGNGRVLLKRPCGRLKVIEKVNGREINPEQSQSQDTTYER